MSDTSTQYIVLNPDTFLWYDHAQGVFYNSAATSSFYFDCTPLLLKYCRRINDFDNMYAVAIDSGDESDPIFTKWIERIVDNRIGRVMNSSPSGKKPFSLPPILNLQHEIEERRMDDFYYRPINVANNFFEATFLLGGEKLPEAEIGFHKQIAYPVSTEICLNVSNIRNFMERNNTRFLQQVNVIAYHMTAYPEWQSLLELMSRCGIPVTYYFQGDDDGVRAIEKMLEYPIEEISLGLYFTDVTSCQSVEALLADKGIGYQWLFLLKDETDWEQIQKILDNYRIENYKLLPVLTGDMSNFMFFRENVFTSSEELLQLTPDKKNIFCNQTINSNYWGQLIVAPDKNVYANLNGKPLGSLDENVLNLVRKEMIEENSYWRCTRDKLVPCKDCIYRYLCPPPSNYEFYLNKYNLCSVKGTES